MTEAEKKNRHQEQEADLRLALAASRGERAARRELATRLYPRIRRAMAYVAGLGSEAEDLAQVAMVRILRYAGTFRSECPLERWADRIAFQTALKHLGKQRRREELNQRYALWDEEMAADPSLPLDAAKVRSRLAQHMERLSAPRRQAVVLHHVQGFSLAEIAELTQASPHTVRDRLYLGRMQLKQQVLSDPLLSEWLEEDQT